ncbi:DUF1266 domain-containing protein [Paractinoplanes rishiriensis]|uniref:DUF1266 domain-containing protein n=1 Tax=Paractinoplanes rishiriensis TaxID=1050105 RepID=A0A919K215_9ACTN|nr:DUF1266 domain-containing protein [Actinoplanes rishiriensis]GIE97585.1 hypothetical protein Ari01nite_50500 [Actinoplanes rishiriensis]
MEIPTFVYVVAPLVVLLFVAQIVFKARSAARSARGMARAFRNVVAVNQQQPTTGDLAAALAVGAHMSLNHGVSWNAIKDDANSAQKTYNLLKSQWDVSSAGEFRECIEGLLDDETADPVADFVLAVRRDLGTPDVDTWRRAVTDSARAQGVPETTVDEMTATIERVLSYEERFRADGLLTGDAVVRSLLAYDWARAVNMARWGLQVRYIKEPQAREYVLRAGKQAFGHYDSWADLSAGYALGRVLRFDNDEFDVWYSTVLEPHQTLFSDPASPWLRLPWPARP